MKLTLIKPNIGHMEHGLYVDEARMEPLPLGVIAGMAAVWIEDRLPRLRQHIKSMWEDRP